MANDYNVSVTRLFGELQAGDSGAAQRLWDVYFEALLREARKRLRSMPRRVTDEEDVAVSVFHKLCDGADAGRFAKVQNRSELWRLLVCITKHKVVDTARRETRDKRGGGLVRGESVLLDARGELTSYGIEQIAGDEPTPEFLASLDEQQRRLLDLLQPDSLRQVAICRIEGYTNEEIAERLEMSPRTVERKLQLIRERWSRELKCEISS